MQWGKAAAALALVALLAVGAAAQIHGVPPSVGSMGSPVRFSSPPGIPPSVGSLGPRGFGGVGIGFGGHIGFSNNRFNPRFNTFFRPFPRRHFVPVYVPVYVAPYYGYSGYGYPQTYDPQPVNAAAQSYADDQGEALTIFERGYRAGRQDAQDERYGNHYLDQREAGPASRSYGPREGEPQVQAIPGPERSVRAAPQESDRYEQPVTLLIFRNGQRMEVHNYAIVGETLWVLSSNLARRIALSDLDLDKTVKENDQRGNPFKLPKHS